MSKKRAAAPEATARVCPVAEKLQYYSETFGAAASDAISLVEELDDALFGRAEDLTPADLKTADEEALEAARDNLQDLFDQVQDALGTVEHIRELRADPDAKWPR